MAEITISKQTRQKLRPQRAFAMSTLAGLICNKCKRVRISRIGQYEKGRAVK